MNDLQIYNKKPNILAKSVKLNNHAPNPALFRHNQPETPR